MSEQQVRNNFVEDEEKSTFSVENLPTTLDGDDKDHDLVDDEFLDSNHSKKKDACQEMCNEYLTLVRKKQFRSKYCIFYNWKTGLRCTNEANATTQGFFCRQHGSPGVNKMHYGIVEYSKKLHRNVINSRNRRNNRPLVSRMKLSSSNRIASGNQPHGRPRNADKQSVDLTNTNAGSSDTSEQCTSINDNSQSEKQYYSQQLMDTREEEEEEEVIRDLNDTISKFKKKND